MFSLIFGSVGVVALSQFPNFNIISFFQVNVSFHPAKFRHLIVFYKVIF